MKSVKALRPSEVGSEKMCCDCNRFPGTGRRCEITDKTVMSYSPICWNYRDGELSTYFPSYN